MQSDDSMSKTAMFFTLAGAINWGLVGLGGFLHAELNVVHAIFGAWQMLEWFLYCVIGLAGIWIAMRFHASCKR